MLLYLADYELLLKFSDDYLGGSSMGLLESFQDVDVFKFLKHGIEFQ